MKRIILILTVCGLALAQESKLTLKECVLTAFQNSIELKISKESLKQAELDKTMNFAAFYPAVNIRLSDKILGFDAAGRDISFLTLTPDTYSASLDVNYNLYNMYKDQDRYRYSQKKYEEAQLALALKKQEISYIVITAYYEVLTSEKNLQIRAQALAQKKEYFKLAESLYKSGIKSRSDYLNAQIQIKKSEISLSDAEVSLKISKAALNSLLGLAPDKELALAEDNKYTAPVMTGKMLFEKMFTGNFDWKKLKLQYDYTVLLTALAERDLLPVLSVDASYSLALDKYAGSSSSWTHSGRLDQNSNWGLSASLSYPLFDGGVNYAKYKADKSSLEIAGLNVEKLKRDLAEEIYSAFIDFNRIYGELELYKLQVDLAKESLALIKDRYQSGISSFLDLIDAELNYTTAELGYYQAIYDYKLKGYAIDKLCGEKLFWE